MTRTRGPEFCGQTNSDHYLSPWILRLDNEYTKNPIHVHHRDNIVLAISLNPASIVRLPMHRQRASTNHRLTNISRDQAAVQCNKAALELSRGRRTCQRAIDAENLGIQHDVHGTAPVII